MTEPKRPTSRAARESERGFSAQQMAVLAWSLARLGAAPATLTAVVEAVAARISELSPRDLTDVVWDAWSKWGATGCGWRVLGAVGVAGKVVAERGGPG